MGLTDKDDKAHTATVAPPLDPTRPEPVRGQYPHAASVDAAASNGGPMDRLRLSITIPGAVSLGAYEGGALAALLVAARELGEDSMVIDSIGAASAGSITALLTSRALLRGVDPVDLMAEAWVQNVSLKALRSKSDDWPLSSAALTTMADEVFGATGPPEGHPDTWQRQPIRISMALTSLLGLTYEIADLTHDTAVNASTYLDWYEVLLDREVDAAGYRRYAEGAIASGSNPIGFAPKNLDRLPQREQYERAGLQGFPKDGRFWYTDGGTVDNEPLGRTIDLAQEIGSGEERLYLLIHCDPAIPGGQPETPWGGDAPVPPWAKTGLHSIGLSRSQTIYEDLRRLTKTNSRLKWTDGVVPAMARGLDAGMHEAGLSEAQAAQIRTGLANAVAGAIEQLRSDEVHIDALAHRASPAHRLDSSSWEAMLGTLVRASSGLEGRQPVKVEVISPLVDPSVPAPPAEQLAGLFFFHFGGFFDIRFRRSDFLLGYSNMQCWMQTALGGYLPPAARARLAGALDEVQRRRDTLGWSLIEPGKAGWKMLTLGEKLTVIRFGVHLLRVLCRDLRHKGV
jgi:predicted acylesterase/phospholipase RssA